MGETVPQNRCLVAAVFVSLFRERLMRWAEGAATGPSPAERESGT
jgi:hypothetical protein